ncbi:MAG: ATP-binding cassette domain-containing protein, partial [Mesorhizobium sp.]
RLEREYGLEVDPDAVIEELPVGLQQRVEILKALYRGAEILILDEPTGVLTPAEADHLFRILKQLKEQGKTVVLITHKLREIMAITDTVSVMRQGTMVATRVTKETTVGELAELMVGRRVLLRVEKGQSEAGAIK